MDLNKIYQHNVLDPWPFPDKSVNCIITSPPYWNLRNYNVEGQLGLEKTPAEFIDKMVQVFREAWRVLRDDGTLWINIGDCYASQGGRQVVQSKNSSRVGGSDSQNGGVNRRPPNGIKAKDLVGIPWMLAFALRADGWYLRQDIIWSKPNPMPESIGDRFTKSHEYLFLFTKSKKYFFDQEAVSEPVSPNTHARLSQDIEKQIGSARASGGEKSNGNMKAVPGKFRKLETPGSGTKNNSSFDASVCLRVERRNKRSVWEIVTRGFSEAHFATFPEELIIAPILAGCPPGGVVLDPFMGAGTTGLVALKNGRNFLGLDLNPKYIKMAERRLQGVQLGSGIV